jgi:hypothetical protein
MTNQEFNASYQLLKQVTDGEVRTYHALAATGAVVMVHLLRPDNVEQARALLALINGLSPSRRDRILAITDVEGTPLVVSRFLLDFSSFREWLEKETTRAGAQRPEPTTGVYERVPGVPPVAPPTAAPSLSQQRTEWPAPARPGAATPPPAPPAPPMAAAPPPAPPAPMKRPAGERDPQLTREFAAPHLTRPQEPEPPARAAPPRSEPEPEAGEFTRMFRSVSPPPAAGPPPAAPGAPARPAAPPPGGSAGHGERGAPRAPEGTGEPARREPGEFTRMFRAVADDAPAGPAAAAAGPGARPGDRQGVPPREQAGWMTPPAGEQPGGPPAFPEPVRPDPAQPPGRPEPPQPPAWPEPPQPPARPEPPRHPDPTHPQPDPRRQPDPGQPPRPVEPPTQPPPPGLPQQPVSGGGEFTRMFGAPARPDDLPPAAPAASAGRGSPPSAGSEPPWQPPARSEPPAQPPADPWRTAEPPGTADPWATPLKGPPTPGAGSGGATEVMRGFGEGARPAGGPPAEPPKPPPTLAGPGEFTRIFGAPVPPGTPGLPPRSPAEPPTRSDFTGLFDGSVSPQRPTEPGWASEPPSGSGEWSPGGQEWSGPPSSPAPDSPRGGDYLSKLGGAGAGGFQPPHPPMSSPRPPAVPGVPGSPPVPGAPGGWNLDMPRPPAPPPMPSEFTRIIASQPALPEPAIPVLPRVPAPPGMPAPPAAKLPSKIWVIVGLVVVVLVTIATLLALLLAGRPRSEPVPAPPPTEAPTGAAPTG